ncbi:MAG: hypothetical protein SGJ20_08025 [Planctomycetota bacterium]|nr:hypothetical protein [Planctomycetota bacterium]
MTVVAAAVACVFVNWDQSARLQRSIASGPGIVKVHYSGDYDPDKDPSPVPAFLQGLFDHHHFRSVTRIATNDAHGHLSSLSKLPKLDTLVIVLNPDRPCSAEDFRELRNVQPLRSLSVCNPRLRPSIDRLVSLDDSQFNEICSLTQLETLELGRCHEVSPAILAKTVQLTSLNSLTLCLPKYASLNWRGDLSGSPLTSLRFRRVREENRAYYSRRDRTLPVIDLSGSQNPLAFLTELRQLRSLSVLLDVPTRQALIDCLPKPTNLQQLGIYLSWDCKHEDKKYSDKMASIGSVIPMSLEKLTLEFYDHLTDEDLMVFAKLPKLKALKVYGARLATDVGVLSFLGAAHMEYLEFQLSGNTNEGAKKLRTSLPTTEVITSWSTTYSTAGKGNPRVNTNTKPTSQ